MKIFNVKGGFAIEFLGVNGINSGVISGKASTALTTRCERLGFNVIATGSKNKLPKLEENCHRFSIHAEEIAFCGDDVRDLPILEHCGLSEGPTDAYQIVLEQASWVSTYKGGSGMARDFVDHLLLAQIYQPPLDKIALNDLNGVEQ